MAKLLGRLAQRIQSESGSGSRREMPPHWIVEALDIVEDIGACGLARSVVSLGDSFRLHRGNSVAGGQRQPQ